MFDEIFNVQELSIAFLSEIAEVAGYTCNMSKNWKSEMFGKSQYC